MDAIHKTAYLVALDSATAPEPTFTAQFEESVSRFD
jgi:hypothetical protein